VLLAVYLPTVTVDSPREPRWWSFLALCDKRKVLEYRGELWPYHRRPVSVEEAEASDHQCNPVCVTSDASILRKVGICVP
jgi:hypothetical protein